MNTKELCSWLREHSSGAYRPCSDAADFIEYLAKELEYERNLRRTFEEGLISLSRAVVEAKAQ